ncbi:hypothetical protein GGH92_010836 [Coemansia sp. RSA 2673]|nr:hypothetical protein GGH92_010836 [Coemansia sp. RSA 2673]
MGEHANRSDVYGRQTGTHVLKHLDVVQIVVNNHDYYSHPFHLHGHVFQIIETGDMRSRERHAKAALDTPIKRDTVVIGGGHYAMTFVEAPDKIQRRLGDAAPDMFRENCVAQGIRTSGNAFGDHGTDLGDRDQLSPSPYPDQFESADPPSGWKLISYMLQG